MASDQTDSGPKKIGWWARRAGIVTIAGGSLLPMGGREDPKPNGPEQPQSPLVAHDHKHDEKNNAHKTEPFPSSIEYSAINDALHPSGVRVPVPQSSKEWLKLLSQHYDLHAGFVPSSVAAPSSLKEPRIIISVSDPKRANKRNLSGKLFFGFVYHRDGTRDIEFISMNRQTKEFDFGKIEGAELRRPPIADCLQCHTDAKPFPLSFPYADTNFNPALSEKLIATLFSEDPAVIKRLGEITEAASQDKNPATALNEMLVAEFGAASKNPLLHGGVPIVPRLSLDGDIPLFDIETRKAGNQAAISDYLAQIPNKSLRSQLITLSLKHTLASDIERTFSKKGTNKKVQDVAAEFGDGLDRLMAKHKELTPDNAGEILEIPGGFGAITMRKSEKATSIFDIRNSTNLADIFTRNAGRKQKKPPQFADAAGLAVNMGAADMPFLIHKTAEGLSSVAEKDPSIPKYQPGDSPSRASILALADLKNKLAVELLADILKSDRIDKLASSGMLPTRDQVMTVLVEGIQQEAKKQYGVAIVIGKEEYTDTSFPLPLPKIGGEGGRPPVTVIQNIIEQNCISCHGGAKPLKGAIPMDGNGWKELFTKDPRKARDLYAESIRRVDEGEMPRGKKLTDAERGHIIDWLRNDPSIPRELRANPKEGKDR